MPKRRARKNFKRRLRRDQNRSGTLVHYGKRRIPNAKLQYQPGPVVPDIVRTKLYYTMTALFGSTAGGTVNSQVFRGNSIFDPDFSGAGVQPTGFDQWATMYNTYRVHASEIAVAPIMDSTNGAAFRVAVYPSNASAGATLLNDSISLPYCKAALVSLGRPLIPLKGLRHDTNVIKNYMSTQKILGVTSIQQDSTLAASIAANPAGVWYWVVDFDGQMDSTANYRPNAQITLTYYVEFFNRAVLDQS